jgi:hypothetical protein
MGEPLIETVEKLNGRSIRRMGPNGCLGWLVEVRGPRFKEQCLQVWRKTETLEAAREEAIRRGPLPDEPEA